MAHVNEFFSSEEDLIIRLRELNKLNKENRDFDVYCLWIESPEGIEERAYEKIPREELE